MENANNQQPGHNEGGHRSFSDKRRFFEKEIKEQTEPKTQTKQFSYLAEHELAKLRIEEEKKTADMSQEEILSYVTGSIAAEMPGDQDYDKVLASLDPRRMKSLEADAVRAQAVIARAQEMSKDSTTSSSQMSTVDIAFADEDDEPNHNGQNGENAEVEVTRQQIYEVNLQPSPVTRFNSAGGNR